jgi:hypothetical protein
MTPGTAMGQMGFYDLDKRLEAISAKGIRSN